jgi:hypothetical protein
MRIIWSPDGGADLIGKSGRKTANACDESAKDATRNTAARFMLVATNTSQKVNHPGAIPLRSFAKRYYYRFALAVVFEVSF